MVMATRPMGTGTVIPPMGKGTVIPPMATAMATPRRPTATAIRLITVVTPGRTTAPMRTQVARWCGGPSSIAHAGADG
jgi:hypothetical protein